MKAVVFKGKGLIAVEEVPRPVPGAGEAVIRITATTICGTDVHILKGEYPVERGLTVGHEPVGRVEALGPGVTGFRVGDRVIAGAITLAGSARLASTASTRNAVVERSAAGVSATRSTAARPSTS